MSLIPSLHKPLHIAHSLTRFALLAALPCITAAAYAQSNVDATKKYSWQENCGWMNWRDAHATAQGARLAPTSDFLSGFIWCENIGWINLGNGAGPYANTNGTNFGVNHAPGSGLLSGLAWGENVGWINFSGGALASPAQPARLDPTGSRLRGYAWGENIGWINLDIADDGQGKFVAFSLGSACDSIDFNNDGLFPDTTDIDDFLSVFSGGSCSNAPNCNDIDFNNDGLFPDTMDIDSLLSVFAGGPCL
jgi:hypothetical protein